MVTTGYVERDARAGELKLHYQEWGSPSAPAVLMLHGFGVSGHMFDEFAQRMQDRYRLIAVDQRGHGDSDWASDGDYSREAFVADIEAFRQSLGLERFILVGHSMGGLNAVTYAASHPERVRSLVLVDVGPEAAKEGVDNIRRFTRGPDELEFEEFVSMAHRFNPRRTVENIRERMRTRLRPLENGKWTWKFDKRFRQEEGNGLRIGSELSNDETWQLFRKVQSPTLLVRGGESDVLTPEVAQRTATEMPRARLAVVPGAGHSVPGDNPDEFTTAVRAFLEDVEGGRVEAAGRGLEPPPLREAVEHEQAASGRRRGSLVTLIVLGAGVVLAFAGFTYLFQRRNRRGRQKKGARARARMAAGRVSAPIRSIDIDDARRRARLLATELGRLGQRGAGRARAAVSEIDVEPARRAALDVIRVLGEKSREVPAAAVHALESVDRGKLRPRAARRRKKQSSLGSAAVRSLVAAAPWVIGQLASGKKRRRKTGPTFKGWRK